MWQKKKKNIPSSKIGRFLYCQKHKKLWLLKIFKLIYSKEINNNLGFIWNYSPKNHDYKKWRYKVFYKMLREKIIIYLDHKAQYFNK